MASLDSASRLFRIRLLRWFDREKRTLPWRGETDPYRILVSEIMLQQTRVAVVKERYKQFLRQFPNVSRLAHAKEETVLAAWSGLGYYRRARALHAAAKHVRRQNAFPRSASELAQLPGIGRYTAAAVASIAFGEPVAVVDGNVKRVLQRLTGGELSNDACWESAEALLDKRRPGDFNQAMMELGATVCLPREPLCARCPVIKFCASSSGSKASDEQSKRAAVRKKATLAYLLTRKNGSIRLQRRAANLSLMPGMWELPPLEAKQAPGNPVLKLRHAITNTDYRVLVYENGSRINGGSWMPLRSLTSLPLTGLARKILQRLGLLA